MSGYNPYGGTPPQYPSPQSVYPNLNQQQSPTAPPSSLSYPQGQQQQPSVPPSTFSYPGQPYPPQPGFQYQYPGQPGGQSVQPQQYPGSQQGQPQQYPGSQQGQPQQYPGGQQGQHQQYPGGQQGQPQQYPGQPPQYPGGQPGQPPQYPGGQPQLQPAPVQYPGQPTQPTQYPGQYNQATPTLGALHPDPYAGLIEWVPSTPQQAQGLSNRAIVAGQDADGTPLWVIRARFQGDLIPGKLAVKHHAAYVPWGGKENSVQQFEVCCCDHPERIRWLASQDGRVPPNAIRGGTSASGEILYIGRARHDKSVTPGKIHQGHQAMYISFGGKEVSCKQYEVLCGA